MTYQEQLKQMSDEELIEERSKLENVGFFIKADEVKSELLNRLKQPTDKNPDIVNVTGEPQPPPITVNKGEAEPRLLNQLRIHWKWLKEQPYEEVAKFCTSILIERGYKISNIAKKRIEENKI